MKVKVLFLLAPLVLFACGVAFSESVTLDHVGGNLIGGKLGLDSTYVFYMRFNSPDNAHVGFTTGWRVYSDDGATWDTTVIYLDTFVVTHAMFDLGLGIQPAEFYANWDGAGADTVGVWGSKMMVGTGWPKGFNAVVATITIGPISQSSGGKQICLDSSYYPPSGTWKWAGPEAFPSWDGVHCWQVESGSGVDRSSRDMLPTVWALGQNYPNPFNPTTEIQFDVPTQSHVTLTVFNVLGQKVVDLVNEDLSVGHYTATWDGTSAGGSVVSSGVYFYRIEGQGFLETKKMMLIK